MKLSQNPQNVATQYKNSAALNTRFSLHRDYSVNPKIFDDWLFEQITFDGAKHVLDVGCGDARLWERGRKRLPKDVSVTLADFSEGMLDAAKARLEIGGNGEFSFRQCDVQALPFDDGTFDAVMAFHMLYHVPDIDKAVSELRRVLKPGGRFYASTNGENTMRELHLIIAGFDKNINYPFGKDLLAFHMGNGEEWLGKTFSNVERRDYEDALRITVARPLMDYCFSMGSFTDKDILREREDELEAYLNGIIEKEGFIYIGKQAGLLIAS